jgi:hypothetical protein
MPWGLVANVCEGSKAKKLDLNSMSALPPIWLHLSLPPK